MPSLGAMKTVEIENEILECILNDGEEDGWKHIETIRGDEHRWYFDMTTIITQDNVDFYGFDWVDDKTEMGDMDAFEYTKGATPETTTATEYKPVTKVVVEYVPVP